MTNIYNLIGSGGRQTTLNDFFQHGIHSKHLKNSEQNPSEGSQTITGDCREHLEALPQNAKRMPPSTAVCSAGKHYDG